MHATDRLGVALVAGGSGGVGQAIARKLGADGFDIAVGYRRNVEVARQVVQALEAGGRRALAVRMDLEQPEEVHRGVADTVDALGTIDVAVYAAGPYIPQLWIGDVQPEMMRTMLSGDAYACFTLLSCVLPALRESHGSFVAITTPAAQRHIKKDVLSAVPKAAVEAIVRAVASEEGRFGVRANCVGVGFIDAGMFHELREKGEYSDAYVEAALRNIPLGRMGSAEDIAEAVAFVASRERAGYVTGQTIVVDGGVML
jgi:NAD(P)-dependent dehydrogenase (short-subunit alcohol dehydrogenase family)